MKTISPYLLNSTLGATYQAAVSRFGFWWGEVGDGWFVLAGCRRWRRSLAYSVARVEATPSQDVDSLVALGQSGFQVGVLSQEAGSGKDNELVSTGCRW